MFATVLYHVEHCIIFVHMQRKTFLIPESVLSAFTAAAYCNTSDGNETYGLLCGKKVSVILTFLCCFADKDKLNALDIMISLI